MVHKLVCQQMICPGGVPRSELSALQVCTGSTVCNCGWKAIKLAVPSGGGCGVWVYKRALQQMFNVRLMEVGRGSEKRFDDTDERITDLSFPLLHTSLSRHVSVSARSIWWPSAPADLPCASKAGTGSAAQHRSPARVIFAPPPAKCAGTTGINETLRINKHS